MKTLQEIKQWRRNQEFKRVMNAQLVALENARITQEMMRAKLFTESNKQNDFNDLGLNNGYSQ